MDRRATQPGRSGGRHERVSGIDGEHCLEVGFLVGYLKSFLDRKKIMTNLCATAEIQYLKYHAFRHAGASLMDSINTPIGIIQITLGHENRL